MTPRFALNQIAVPRHDFPTLVALAADLGISEVEIRNDLPGVLLQDGTPPATARHAAEASGVSILSINALQRFNVWSDTRAEEARALAGYARAAGARALVLCPLNDPAEARTEAARAADLRTALCALAPILAEHGLIGLVEPLGFEESSLRLKRAAIDAIDAVGEEDRFRILHDTFHHFLAGETELFPERTGLVHISGVEDRTVARGDMRDSHRVLVGHADRLGNLPQLMALLRGGYTGAFSFEPFSPEVHAMHDVASAVRDSIAFLTTGLGR